VDHRPYYAANRAIWDEWAALHMQDNPTYPVEAFKAGEKGWTPNLPDDIGPVVGKSLLHLQCHFGMDTLMWARQGAQAVGVDFSGTAIEGARALSRELGLEAEFVRSDVCRSKSRAGARRSQEGLEVEFVQSDVYLLPEVLAGEFDVVLTYFGVLPWLGDLARWAEIAARYLAPGGTFYLADHHPLLNMLEVNGEGKGLVLAHSYFGGGEPERYETDGGSYAAAAGQTVHREVYEWAHTVGEIVTALARAGLRVEYVHEFPFLFFDAFAPHPLLHQGKDGWWRLERDTIPLMFSLRATKP
jgi:SAM-dependent methyltransferase